MRQTTTVADSHSLKCELASEVLRTWGRLRLGVTGWSMLPTIWPGDTRVIERAGQESVSKGDIVLFGRHRRVFAHRVVGLGAESQNPRWITRGDALSVPDRPVAGNELLGRVAHVIRAGKLIAVPTELSMPSRIIAKIVRRSFLAARVLVYLHRTVRISEKSDPRESVLRCQG